MKCPVHNSEAIGVCVYCGRAVCAGCGTFTAPQRLVCSRECAEELSRADRASLLLLQKTLQNTRANAFYYFLCAGLSAAGAVGAQFYLPVPFLVWFIAGSGLVFTVLGIWHARIARKHNPPPK